MGGDKEAGFEYTYDYLGRMERIIYPDGEEVLYEYDRGGQVTKVTGERNGLETEYIERIGYDEYGQRVYIRYGNGVETTYTYDENRRWLDNISTENQYGNSYQEINYQFDTVGNILRMENNAVKYYSLQEYTYDDQYQLTFAEGLYESKPYGSVDYTNRYTQEFTFDRIGNITNKVSEQAYNPTRPHPGQLNYNLEYRYYEGKPHQAEQIGNLWYLYGGNGNIIEEREGGHSLEGVSGSGTLTTDGDLSIVNRGFGLLRNEGSGEEVYMRTFEWDEENRMKRSDDGITTVDYLYDAGGERTVKYSSQGETLYFDSMWQMSLETSGWRQSKHIYVGETRISTRLNFEGEAQTGYERLNTYYYHNDHLGSANIVTAHDGTVYEHIEYTPYGELWVEEVSDSFDKIPFRFTAKEWDEETNLYYYGARYLNPRTSRWMSADPAMESYIPNPGGDPLKLPGEDGVFNPVNLDLYHYAGNNPVKYIDPTGMVIQRTMALDRMTNYRSNVMLGNSSTEQFRRYGCYPTALSNVLGTLIGNRIYRRNIPNSYGYGSLGLNAYSSLFASGTGNMPRSSMDKIFGKGNWDYWTRDVQGSEGLLQKLREYEESGKKYLIVGIFDLTDVAEDVDNHMVGINGLPGEDGVFSIEDIVPSSQGDRNRLADENQRQAYNVDNLKEFRVIEVK